MANTNTFSFSYRRKHTRQSISVAAGTLLLIGGGILFLPFVEIIKVTPTIIYSYDQSIYLAGILSGAIISSVLLTKLRKVIHYYIAAACLITNGALFASHSYKSLDVIKAGLFFGGLSFGIALLTYIIHAAEISVKYLRGFLVSNIQFAIDCGIFIRLVYGSFQSYGGVNSIDEFKLIGGINIALGIISLPLTYFYVYESPIFLMEANNESEAIENLVKLRREPNSLSNEIQTEISEIRNILTNKSNLIPNSEDVIPFIKLLYCRVVYSLATSITLTAILSAYFTFYLESSHIYVFFLGRLFACLVSTYLIEAIGRKFLLSISFVGGGILLIVVQAIISNASDLNALLDAYKTAGLVSVFYMILIGIGAGPVSYTYMSEGFNHSKKTYMNAAIITIECLVQIIVIQTINSYEAFIYVTGVFQLLIGVLSFFIFPETKGKSLSECANLMK